MIRLHGEEMLQEAPSKYFETYVKLSKNRIIFLSEDFSKEVSSSLSALLLHYDHQNSEEDITIYINSNGGDASALSNIYDVIQMIKAPVKTICLGKCYSAGAILLCAGTKGKRYALPNSEIMIHGIQCVFPVITDASQIDATNYLQFLNSTNDNIMKILAKHTGHSLEKIKEDCKKDIWLNAKEALEYGVIDHILTP